MPQFPLSINGFEVCTIEDLKKHFSPEELIASRKRFAAWLKGWDYDEEAAEVKALSSELDDKEWLYSASEIIGISKSEVDAAWEKQKEKKKQEQTATGAKKTKNAQKSKHCPRIAQNLKLQISIEEPAWEFIRKACASKRESTTPSGLSPAALAVHDFLEGLSKDDGYTAKLYLMRMNQNIFVNISVTETKWVTKSTFEKLYFSDDGKKFTDITQRYNDRNQFFSSLGYLNDTYLFRCKNIDSDYSSWCQIFFSSDGLNWDFCSVADDILCDLDREDATSCEFKDIIFDGNQYLALCTNHDESYVARSEDMDSDWEVIYEDREFSFSNIYYSNGMYYLEGINDDNMYVTYYSNDAEYWDEADECDVREPEEVEEGEYYIARENDDDDDEEEEEGGFMVLRKPVSSSQYKYDQREKIDGVWYKLREVFDDRIMLSIKNKREFFANDLPEGQE